jgi:hypothetical protein
MHEEYLVVEPLYKMAVDYLLQHSPSIVGSKKWEEVLASIPPFRSRHMSCVEPMQDSKSP